MHDTCFLFRNVLKECFLNNGFTLTRNSLKTVFHCPAHQKHVHYGPGCVLSPQRTSTEWGTFCAETSLSQYELVHTAHPSRCVLWR